MRFLHLSDLHFGKSLYGVSLIDNGDQAFWKERFLERVQEVQPDAVVISGESMTGVLPPEMRLCCLTVC